MSANNGFQADDEIIIRNTTSNSNNFNNTLADPVSHRNGSTTAQNIRQPNENTSLNVDTYFSEEKVQIPEIEKVRFLKSNHRFNKLTFFFFISIARI